MYEYHSYHNYDLQPKTTVAGLPSAVSEGYPEIIQKLLERCGDLRKTVIVCDLYPGVSPRTVANGLSGLNACRTFYTDACRYPQEITDDLFRDSLLDDRVFGYMTSKKLQDCFDPSSQDTMRDELDSVQKGIVLVIGTGASLVTHGDLLLYFDVNRWEIQLRYRAGASNWLADNPEAPILQKYKRGFFIEWRLADRHKDKLFSSMDYILDCNDGDAPKMLSREAFFEGMSQASRKPFRMEPYFDPGVWGGQWMKQVFDLDPAMDNYAWSFDGVPEENNINLQYGNRFVSLPMMDMTLVEPVALLGRRNLARFGREFPIRFDLLDTMDGQNLSLQVHPLTEYIQQSFGMHYTQDESYYILDAKEDACVYIGLKEGVDPIEMRRDLEQAQAGASRFDVERYVNKVPVKKHDHILIPAGTIHCSGRNTMVLEISATPYIFTFKLWDWGRLGLDGSPRPIHIEHGLNNIQWNRTTGWVMDNLVHQERLLSSDASGTVERTGLHEWEFIETRRYTTSTACEVRMGDGMDVLNLVSGRIASLESVDGSFEPFEIHYAETGVVPASVGRYRIRAIDGEVRMIVASVRS